jgi:hypothetical protein
LLDDLEAVGGDGQRQGAPGDGEQVEGLPSTRAAMPSVSPQKPM